MNSRNSRWLGRLPYDSPLPAEAHRRPWAKAARIAGYVLILGAILTSVIQYGHITARNQRRAEAFDAKYGHLGRQEQAALGLERPKDRTGAIARWRVAIREFWAGRNIYQARGADGDGEEGTILHPNMPAVVILLTPFSWLPLTGMAWALGVLKAAVFLAAMWALVRVASHRGLRMPDWVVFLAALWALPSVLGDIRHGNTNLFVLGAIALHLWLYRRGRDVWAGASLALAVCLKMTPALFGLYWLYQRNWRLLAGLVAAMVFVVAVVPLAAVGPDRSADLMGEWWANLIRPGLVEGQWYPIHVNQSLPGVVGRYVLGGPGGNIFWGPDDDSYEEQMRKKQSGDWINVVSLSEPGARMLVRVLQAAIVLLMAWTIGWRRLGRDDGRRALHYGLVVLGMLILNQRTWDHHAAVLPVATLPVWYALAMGRGSLGSRRAALVLALAALPMLFVPDLASAVAGLFGADKRQTELATDLAEAYGPVLLYFLLMLAAGIVLARALRKTNEPYAGHGPLASGGSLGPRTTEERTATEAQRS